MNRSIAFAIVVVTAIAGAYACGGDKKKGAADGGLCGAGAGPEIPLNDCFDACDRAVTMTGDVRAHPTAVKELSTPTAYNMGDMTKLKITVQEPLKVLSKATKCVDMGNSPQFLSAKTTNEGSYVIKDINADKVPVGLIANVQDTDTARVGGVAPTTGSGIIRKFIQPDGSLTPSGATQAASLPAFVLPRPFVDKLATAFGKTTDALIADGFVFGQVGEYYPGDPNAILDYVPTAGAVVSTSPAKDGNGADWDIRYPNATFTGVNTTGCSGADPTCTASHGIFVIIKANNATPLELTAKKGTKNFPMDAKTPKAQAASKPDTIFVTIVPDTVP